MKEATSTNQVKQINGLSSSVKHFKLESDIIFTKESIRSFENQLTLKDKIISEHEVNLNLKAEKILILQQENAHLKLENKKLSLSINSPGKVLTLLSKHSKSSPNDSSTSLNTLLKDKAQLKESNDTLLLLIAEKESELCHVRESYETQILSLNNTIYSLKAKERDLSNDIDDLNAQLTDKGNLITHLEESNRDLLAKLNVIKAHYEPSSNDNKDTYSNKDNDYYKQLEQTYTESIKKTQILNDKYTQAEQHFLKGSATLNREIANLLENNCEMNAIKEELEQKIKALIKDVSQLKNDFKMLQDTMTALREKDDYDITLIEERYIVLESILNTDKAELLQQNRDLLNQLEAQCVNNGQLDYNAIIHDNELKLLNEENRLIQIRIKEQEKIIEEKERLYEENNGYQSEIKLLKSDIEQLKEQYGRIKEDLVGKTMQLTNELVESRKRTSLLRSESHMFIRPNANGNTNASHQGNDKEDKTKTQTRIEDLERELFLLKKQREQDMKEHKKEIETIEDDAARTKSELTALSYENEVELLRYKNEVKKLNTILTQHKIKYK